MEAFLDKFSKIPILQKLLGMVLCCLLIAMGFYMLVLSPIKDEQELLSNNIASLENSLASKKKMVGDLSQYKREVEKLNQNLQKALKLLPNKSEIPSLLQKISSLAKKSGLEIVSFQPTPEIPQDFYAKVPVSLNLKGSYNEVVNFFDAAGKLSRIVNIGNFNFNLLKAKGKGKVSRKKSLNVNCIATTFRFIPQKAGADQASGAKKKGKKKGKKGH